jgi:hypothetical protein
MKKIILQHYHGTLGELELKSKENIESYAKFVGADYQLLTGFPFDPFLSPQMQKLHMISQEFDDWDEVLMVDIDMFTPKGMEEDVFEVSGIGMYEAIQQGLHRGMVNSSTRFSNINSPYWGGAIYKMDKSTRESLRSAHLAMNMQHPNWTNQHPHHDEGAFHTLAYKAGLNVKDPGMFIPQKWCWCSYLPNPEKAGFIHIRTKTTPRGPKRTKIENYNELVQKGII